MSKNVGYKLKHLLVILLSINKKIIEWSLENIQGRIVSEDILKREESKVQVVSTEYIGDLDDLDDPILLSQKIEKLLNRLTKEQMEKLEKDVLSINDIFTDERFIKAYFKGSHEDIITVIEDMYFESRMNAKMLRALMEVGLIKLEPKDHERFCMIGLLYSWDDPLEIEYWEMRNKKGIK